MAKRHQIRAGDWESVVGRLQELVLASSGADEFQEIFKLLVAKLYSEKFPRRAPDFQVYVTPAETAAAINGLIARANSQWSGIADGDPHSCLTDEHLTVCVEAIAAHSICDTNLEILDGFFEFLVSRVAKGAKGQYFTPRQIVDCCVKIVDPSPTDTILDPACGSGGFLIHTLNHNLGRINSNIQDYCKRHIWGCDFDARAIQIATALMLVAGDSSANLHQLNSLRTPSHENLLDALDSRVPKLTIEDLLRTKTRRFQGFDVILTNPPFAGEIREPSMLSDYEVVRRSRRMERDVLFLERCVQLLRPGGKLGIVLPHNKFGGNNWAYLREWLTRRVRVVAVVGLDRNTFLPHTHQKTSVLFGIKRSQQLRSPQPEPILFSISESSGKDSKGRIRQRDGSLPEQPAWIRADHDLDDVVGQFHDFVAEHDIEWSQ